MKNTRKACPTPPRTPRVTRKAAVEREPKPAETIKECTRATPPRTQSVTRKAAVEREPKPAETIKERTRATPPRTPSVTRKAAVVREPKPAETVKKCNDMLFNNLMTYLEGKILQYFQIMNEIQKEVYKEYTTEGSFKFYRFVNMNVHVKICNLLATKWARTDLKELYQKAFDFYLQKVYPAASTFSVKYQEKIAEYGRILTGIAFVNGDYYLGLTCAVTVLELLPHDSYMFVMVSKWSCQLREFDILDKYDNLAKKHSSEVEVIRSVCRLYSEFFKITNVEKQLEIVDKLIGIKTELKSSSEKTFFGYHALFLIFNLLGHASKLPMMDIEKYGDMMSHFFDEQHCALVIASCRIKEFKLPYDKPPFIYDYEKLPDSQVFLKCVMTIPDYCDSEIEYAKISLENGCVHECEGHLVSALYYGTLLSAPFRVLQPLNGLYYLKFRTINDKEKLKGLGAMIALLLGKLSDAKNSVQPYSRFRADLISDTYTFKAQSDSESVLNKTMVTYISRIPEHLPECDCFLCYETATNGSLYSEIQYSNFLIDGFTIQYYNDFKSNVSYYGYRRYLKRKDVLLQIAALKEQNEKEKKMAPLSLLKYICEASTHCLLANKNISEDSKEKMCKNIIGCAAYYYLDLRYYYLLARQLQRKTYSLDAYFWLKNDKESSPESNNELDLMFESFDAFGISKTEQQRSTPPKSPSREALTKQANFYKSHGKKGLGLGGMTDEERNEFNQARIDFKVFQHLLFSEWRRRICLYLGSYLAEDFPWYSAWYFHESRAISLRQHVRLRKTSSTSITAFEDLRFKDIVEFKAAVRALPSDFTLVQLIVDEKNILWLIRCGYDLIPIVLPLKKIMVGKDDISYRMYNLLLENDQSVSLRATFWKIREQLNTKLVNLISDVEYKWLDKFRVLLIPFGNTDASLQKNIDAAKKVLTDIGFSEERGKFLATLFIHAYQDDYKYLLSIFSFVERETFGNPVNANLQERIYKKLMKACPETLFVKYLKKDRYSVLIVSPELSCYPWESLPIYSNNPYVLRIQSFHFFDRLTKKANTPLPVNANSRNSYYVLNPGGDLDKTEKRITECIDLKKLDGVKGKYPTVEKFLEILKENDFFLYIGHGSGTRYFGQTTVRKSICKAVAILMGCSSVRIDDEGHGFDGISAVNDYTIAGAPCTIGCLWMVTDGEIDKFFIRFIEQCFNEWSSSVSNPTIKNDDSGVNYSSRLLIKAIVQARQACRLKTLTGGAVVVYGIPVLNQNLEKFDRIEEESVIILDD